MPAPRFLDAKVQYIAAMTQRPRYYANDHSRDVLSLDERVVRIENARLRAQQPTLEEEGFALVPHASSVEDFRNAQEVAAAHPAEIERLIARLSGADAVVVSSPGILRFAEKSPDCGRLNNSRPARFIHIDVADTTAAVLATRACPAGRPPVRRFCHYNVWRAVSGPPQDVPLAVCEARTVEPQDLVPADAVFDEPGKPEWSFEGLLVRYSPRHRWAFFPDMTRDEVLVFKTNDSDAERPGKVPHTAFDDPTCASDAPPRCSIEMRAIAFWFDS